MIILFVQPIFSLFIKKYLIEQQGSQIGLDAVAPGLGLHSDIEFHALHLLNRREPVPVHFHDLDHLCGHAEFEFLHFVH